MAGTATGAVTGLLAGCTEDAQHPNNQDRGGAAAAFDPHNWRSVRAQFAMRGDLARFAVFILSGHPHPVRTEIDKHRRALDADPEGYLEGRTERDAQAREAVARYLGAAPDEVALTNSTTHGLGLFYAGLRLAAGEEILTTEHDFYATQESLRLRAQRTGADIRRVRLYDDPARASVDRIVDAVARAVGPRTRAVAVTWVHSGTGVKLPIREIADVLGGRALLCVDGVHGFGVEDADAVDLGCDVLISGCHKWLHGPRGTGFIWATPEAWAQFTPVIPTFDQDGRGAGHLASPGGYQAYEQRWALPAAVQFHEAIRRARVAARIRELASALKQGLSKLDEVRLITPKSAQLSAGIVCCEIAGMQPQEAVARLRQAGVEATVTPYAQRYVRFGTSIATDHADVDKAIRAVKSLR